MGRNSTILSALTFLTPKIPSSERSKIDGDILLARILLVVISMVPVIPFLIEPWGFFTSTSTLKLLVEAVALFDTKLSLLVIISPVASLIETL